MRKVLLLGASGSIGSQTLDLLLQDPASFLLTGFSVGKRVNRVGEILAAFPSVKWVCVQKEEDYEALKGNYPGVAFFHGDQGLIDLIDACDCDMVVNALVGFSGLCPSVESLNRNKILCLANKESLVVGGALINKILASGKGVMHPIDSEHVAIAKLFSRVNMEDVDSLWITASGGSFRNKKREELTDVTPEMALAHPTWSMGAKITIDSATMMNKGFEILEAKWLYDFPLEKTFVLMHDESHVHSLIKMKDGSMLADVSVPDMHGPIAYALYERKVDFDLMKIHDLKELAPLHFHEFDENRYPAVTLALKAYHRGGTATAILNASNEEAVYAFLDKKIPFLAIEEIVSRCLEEVPIVENPSLKDIISCDAATRAHVRELVTGGEICKH